MTDRRRNMEDPDSSAARASKIHRLSKSECTTRVKDIFRVRLTRNGKETVACNRCFELQEQERGRDWQLVLSGVTKAKEHGGCCTSCCATSADSMATRGSNEPV